MRKIMVIGQLPPPFHGSNVMAEHLVNSLKKKYLVIFISKNFSKTINDIGKISLRKIKRSILLFFYIPLKIFISKPSICIYFPAVGKKAFFFDFLYLYLIKKCSIPYVLRFGGKGYCLLEKQGYFWNKIVRSALSNAVGGIVLGNNMKWDVNTYIPNSRLLVVPNGVPNPTVKKRICNDRKIRVLFLGNLHSNKGVFEVLEAARLLIPEKKYFFTLAGSFSSKLIEKKIKSFVFANNLEKVVNFPGKVTGIRKVKIFNDSDIFLFPTYYEKEVFGTVNVEAMSYGLPVITSSEGAIPEIVLDGICGFIIDPKSPEKIVEKIIQLGNDPSLMKSMGEKGKEIFKKKYTLESYAYNLYSAVIKFFEFSRTDGY